MSDWEPFMLPALGVLVLLVLLWYSRNRPYLDPRLGYAIGREGSAAGLLSRPFAEGPLPARLLGLVVDLPLIESDGERVLAWVHPTDDALYQLRLLPGSRIEAVAAEESIRLQRGLATLAIERRYRLHTESGVFLFRLEYQ